MALLSLNVLGVDISITSNKWIVLSPIKDRFARYVVEYHEEHFPQCDDYSFALIQRQNACEVKVGNKCVLLEESVSWPRVEDLVVFALRRALPQLAFLHASCVSTNGRAALFIGPSLHGKSTLAYALANRGFSLISDDLAPIELSPCVVHSFLTSATLRRFTCRISSELGWLAHDGFGVVGQKAVIRSLFFLTDENCDARPSGPRTCEKGPGEDLETLFFGSVRSPMFSSPSATPASPPNFTSHPKLAACSSTSATRLFLKHMFPPEQSFSKLLAGAASLVASCQAYSLLPGQVEATADMVANII